MMQVYPHPDGVAVRRRLHDAILTELEAEFGPITVDDVTWPGYTRLASDWRAESGPNTESLHVPDSTQRYERGE